MILSSASTLLGPSGPWPVVVVAVLLYLLAAAVWTPLRRFAVAAFLGAFVLHALLLLMDIAGLGQPVGGARLGFGPVLSMTVWLVIAVYAVESRLLPVPTVRQGLGLSGAVAVGLAAVFPGETKHAATALAPLHFALGVGSYALFGAAVLHGLMLDAAEHRLRAGLGGATESRPVGMPLMQLERLTFNFVAAGFAALSATLALGLMTTGPWRLEHKTVFGFLAWLVFAALLAGRHWKGWRGRRATRWLYVGAALLLLAYAGSRFVIEVLLRR
jgi:ABC-type uncharacterized transport system permease subunit